MKITDGELKELTTLENRKKFRAQVWIIFSAEKQFSLNTKLITALATQDNIVFLYFTANDEKFRVTKKTIQNILKRDGELWTALGNTKYLVIMTQKSDAPLFVWVDLANRTNPKITSFDVDIHGTFNHDEKEHIYKNRTLREQLQELSKDVGEGGRELRIRYLKKFFEKQKLTEDFYAIYKTELFDKIKKNLIKHFGKEDEDGINNFILINLNRLLFIHFLDKKWWVFKAYDTKYGSYISYLFHKIYKESGSDQPFYEKLLRPLFFDVFNKPQTERQVAHDKILFEEFYDLSYLNGWLFKPTTFEHSGKYFIDNVFIKVFITAIIDQFNFTITEDTPFDIKVSVDPELLWYIFENLIQDYDNSKNKKKDERSKWWIFYTPKIEVDFMCRQVLIEYLSKKEELQHLKPQFYELFYPEKWSGEDQKYGSFTSKEIWFLFKHLEDIKVVDPACWSWAFLVGMMQVIIDIENTLLRDNEDKIQKSKDPELIAYFTNRKNTFSRKKELIKNTLHGVDIKWWAVEIARLRLRLSMIVDIDETAFNKDSAKHNPLLPSFGFKIVQWDSLVNRIWTHLIPIDIARTDILDNKMRRKLKELATLKKDFYDNKTKDEYNIKLQEKEIFSTILQNKIRRLQGEITKYKNMRNQALHIWSNTIFGTPQFGWHILSPDAQAYISGSSDTKKIDKQIQDLEDEISQRHIQYKNLIDHKQMPFARGIDFSEVFTEQWGFDVVVGNPPYVRQEAIEDPTGAIKDKKDYKNLLVDVVNQDWFDDIRKYKKDDLKIWGRSDLYLYFYFRGLKLLNEQWVFTFITSNSRLDVDFWSILQEFLIKYCPSIKVFDNQVQRSFASASINTIMVFIDKPVMQAKETMTGTAQFVNFHKPYEESIWAETMAELDHQTLKKIFSEKVIKTGDAQFSKRTTDELRVIDIDANNLWIDGSEVVGEKGLDARKYDGNKWGGKFLRAPEIFFTVLVKWWNKIFKFGKILKLTQRNTLQGFSSIPKIITTNQFIDNSKTIPYLSSSKLSNSIVVKNLNNFINTTESEKKEKDLKVQIPDIISNRFIGERLFFMKWWEFFVWDTFFVWFLKDWYEKNNVIKTINSSMQLFFVEIIGRKNMWDWVLLFYGPEFNQLPFINITKRKDTSENFVERDVKPIFEELGFDKTKSIREQTPNPLSDRKELDDIVFDELGLTPEERNEVYRSLAELVKARLDKAKSV